MEDKKHLHDNKDSISCAGSSGGCSDSTVSAHMESSVEANQANGCCDNDAFENSGELSPSQLSASLPRTPPQKNGHSSVDMELADFSPPKILSSHKEASINNSDFNDAGSTNGQNGEYFISINEHKKGIRGEKLYVTKDNRPNQTNSNSVRKCLCWTIGLIFVVAAVTIGALIGVGVIDPKSQRNVGQKDGRARDILREEDLLKEPMFSEVVEEGGAILNHHHQVPETSRFPDGFVKNAYNGQLKITNLAWDQRLTDVNSEMYQDLSSKMKTAIEEVLSPLGDKNRIFVNINSFQAGSVVVNFRIGWVPRDINEDAEVLSQDVILHRFQHELESNEGRLASIYNTDPTSIDIKYLPDDCRAKKCGGSCEYNHENANFICTCPEPTFLNSDGISCVLIEDETDFGESIHQSTKKTTTAMVTMDYVFHEYEDEQAEDTTESTNKTSLEGDGFAETKLSDTTTTNTSNEGSIAVENEPITTTDDSSKVFFPHEIDETPEQEQNGSEFEATTSSDGLRIFDENLGATVQPFSDETQFNHSVQWLSDNGDIMVPVSQSDHETTTLIKIGNIESETENSQRVGLTTTTLPPTTTSSSVEEDTITPELGEKNVDFEISEAETTEIPSSIEIETSSEENLNKIEMEDHAPTIESVEERVAWTTAPPEFESDSTFEENKNPLVIFTEAPQIEEGEITTQINELVDAKEAEEVDAITLGPSIDAVKEEEAPRLVTFTEEPPQLSTTTESSITTPPNEGSTTSPAIEESITTSSVEAIVTTPAIEASTTQIEISFAMADNKEMSEEMEDMLKNSISKVLEDMTTTQEPSILDNDNKDSLTDSDQQLLHDSQPFLAAVRSESEQVTTEQENQVVTTESISILNNAAEGGDKVNHSSNDENNNQDEAARTEHDSLVPTEVSVPITSTEASTPIPIAPEPKQIDFPSEQEADSENVDTTPKPIEEAESKLQPDSDVIAVRISERPLNEITTEATIEISGIEKNINNETFAQALKDLVANVTKEFQDDELKEPSTEPAGISVDISGIDDIQSKDLEQTLTDVLVSVTKELQSTTVGLSGETSTEASTTTTRGGVAEEIEEDGKQESQARPRKLSIDTKSAASLNLLNPITCKENEFKCGDGECINKYLRCDHIFHCEDASDELYCDKLTCSDGEFSCTSENRCLPNSKKCDGHSDCIDGEDESGCKTECDDVQDFFCQKEGRCIPKRLRCDGYNDCNSGEDELSCECSSDETVCQIGGGCVQKSKLCDGHFDCPDNSDEWNCIRIENDSLQIRNPDNSWHSVCGTAWNETWSSLACHQMAFDDVTETTFDTIKKSEENFFSLNSTLYPEEVRSIQAARANIDEDQCELTVKLQCKNNECSKWSHSPDANASSASHIDTMLPSVGYLLHLNDKSTCTVSIIHPRWVITSYVCLSQVDLDPSQWIAIGGSSSSESNGGSVLPTSQLKNVQRIVVHPQARIVREFAQNDLALVELSDGFNLDHHVATICLSDEIQTKQNQPCVTAGWQNVGKNDVVSLNQYVESIPGSIIPMNICNTSFHYNGHLHESVMCAGGRSEKTSCRSDFGAPLMCRTDEGTWQLAGTLAREGECLTRNHPDVFTSIASARSWILNTIGSKV